MNTTTLKERQSLQEDAIFEDDTQQNEDAGMTDEELKIEALKIATNIGKLMSNVTTEDIVNIAETVAKFIKGGESASLETVEDTEENSEEENPADTEEDFETEETPEEEKSEETEENFEV